jgi:DUF971 family protein
MDVQPQKLSLDRHKQLEITWADGTQSVYPIGLLRAKCPCASCKEVREQPKSRLKILVGNFDKPLHATGAEMIGNYALRIDWSDNHSSGIYSFTYLRSIEPK